LLLVVITFDIISIVHLIIHFCPARSIKPSSTLDRLAACNKMMRQACAGVIDARLQADDMVIAGPFMMFVFIGHK